MPSHVGVRWKAFPAARPSAPTTGYRVVHRHLFRDLYAWAGKERKYTTGRGSIPFAVPEHIEPWMRQQLEALAQANFLVGLDAKRFAESAARTVNEINAAHPFVEGNGRTQRFGLRMLADHAGFDLTLRDTDGKRWNAASRVGFMQSDHAPMAAPIARRLTRRGQPTL